MIEFKVSYDGFIRIDQATQWDANGRPGLEIQFAAGPWKGEIDQRVYDLEQAIEALLKKEIADEELRRKNIALQDAWEKYQILLGLTRDGSPN
jgi:hypothetical protein